MPLDKSVKDLVREGLEKKRKYAGYFNWSLDRDQEELGVVQELSKSLEKAGMSFFSDFSLRGRGNDPPDLEALSLEGERIAIEITELVDGDAIRDTVSHLKSGQEIKSSPVKIWEKVELLSRLQELIETKDKKFTGLHGAPYPGGYCLVIFTDEPHLNPEVLSCYLEESGFTAKNLSRCFLLVGYQPFDENLPFFELSLVSR